jgi:hypothetical protein
VTGPSETYGIDTLGHIHLITSDRTQHFILPENSVAVDIAAGFEFSLAVSESGRCYGRGKITQQTEINEYLPIPSLANDEIEHVYARLRRVIVLLKNHTIKQCSLSSNGVLQPFAIVPMGENDIIHVALASESALFLTADGHVLATGFNPNGQLLITEQTVQIPTIVPRLENVIGVVMGAQHSLVYCGNSNSITCPGMRIRKGQGSDQNAAAKFLLSSGFCFGDVVLAGGEIGFISEVERKVVVTTALKNELFSLTEVKLLTRKGFIGIDHCGIQLEGGRLLERLFGLRTGEIVRGSRGIVAVVGLRGKLLVLRDGKGHEIVFSGSIGKFYREYSIVCSWRNIEMMAFGDVELPVEIGEMFFARFEKKIVRVIGRFAAFFVGDDGNKLGLYRDSKLISLVEKEGFFQFDRVRFGSEIGIVILFVGENALFKPDGIGSCKLVPLKGLEIIATLAGDAEIEGISVSAKSVKNAKFLPGDVFVGERGFLTIVGFRGEAVFARLLEGEGLFEIDEKMKMVLVRRELPWGKGKLVLRVNEEVVEVSQFATDIMNTGFRHGDEVEIGEKRGFVVGCDEVYVWILMDDGELFCTSEGIGEGDVTLVGRPGRNWKRFFDLGNGE